ncbi:MAG: chemotaxis protein CheW, partial [Gammaproteobacteria bacterium]
MDMTQEGQLAEQQSTRASAAASQGKAEYLTFRLGAEEYGIDIQPVQEIRSYEEPTRIANAPSFIKGVVNLRGVVGAVVDSVSDVIELGGEQIRPAPEMNTTVDTSFITGIASVS